MRVVLTIDTEQPSRPAGHGNAGRLLDALVAARAPAAFFVQGRWAVVDPTLTRRIVLDGHLVGNHTFHHAPLSLMTDAGISHTVTRADEAIVSRAGIEVRPWFRCPYGDGEGDPRVRAALAALGYRNVPWDVDPHDWRAAGDGRSAADVADEVVAGAVACGDGARVLLHSWPDVSLLALPVIIRRLREAGATIVRLDELGEAAFAPAQPATTGSS